MCAIQNHIIRINCKFRNAIVSKWAPICFHITRFNNTLGIWRSPIIWIAGNLLNTRISLIRYFLQNWRRSPSKCAFSRFWWCGCWIWCWIVVNDTSTMKIMAILGFALVLCMTSCSIFLISLTFSVQTYSRDTLIIYATACSVWQLCKNAVIILTTKSFITIWIWKAFDTWIIWIVGVIWT